MSKLPVFLEKEYDVSQKNQSIKKHHLIFLVEEFDNI